MHYAIDLTDQGRLVTATNAQRHPGYVCPRCIEPVHLKSGPDRVAHFAHNWGKAPADCELYHPGSGSGGVSDNPAFTGPPMYLHLSDETWSLYVVLAPLTGAESQYSTPSALRSAGLELQQKGIRTNRLTASVLWPGDGGNAISIPPSRYERRIRTTGKWPARVKPTRWQQALGGLPQSGALFVSFRGGAFRRYDWSTQVCWGDHVVVMGAAEAHPPGYVQSLSLSSKTVDGIKWFAWSITLPTKPNQAVRSWLAGFGVTVEARHSRTRVLTPPMEYGPDGVPHFYLGDPIAVVLSAQATVIAAESKTLSAVRVTRNKDGAPIYAVRAVESGPLNIRTDANRDSKYFEVVAEASVRMDDFTPVWSVEFGDSVLYPFTTHHVSAEDRQLRVLSQIQCLGLSVSVEHASGLVEHLHRASAIDVGCWLADKLDRAAQITIDAGNLGRVRIVLESSGQLVFESDERRPFAKIEPVDGSRPSAWPGAYAVAADMARDPAVPHWRVHTRTVRPVFPNVRIS